MKKIWQDWVDEGRSHKLELARARLKKSGKLTPELNQTLEDLIDKAEQNSAKRIAQMNSKLAELKPSIDDINNKLKDVCKEIESKYPNFSIRLNDLNLFSTTLTISWENEVLD